MVSAVSAIFNSEERSKRQREKQLARLGHELSVYVREREKDISVILLAGSKIAFALPRTPKFEYLAGLKGSIVVGTYSFRNLQPSDWELLERRMIGDLDSALTEYNEGRVTQPAGAPGAR